MVGIGPRPPVPVFRVSAAIAIELSVDTTTR